MSTHPPGVHVVGLAGHAGIGKSKVSDILYVKHGFRTYALADNVREALLALDPMINSEISLRQLVEQFDWDGAKTHRVHGPEVCRLMQVMGTEVGRNFFGPQCWTRMLASDIEMTGGFGPSQPIVIDDIHFDDEADWVHSMGGVVWQVIDPGTGPLNRHQSERPISADRVDRVILSTEAHDIASAIDSWLFESTLNRKAVAA